MSDLIAFLRRCLDDDERVARAAADYGDTWRPGSGKTAIYPSDERTHPGPIIIGPYGDLEEQHTDHIVRHDPARVLAEVDAKRRILDLHYPIHRDIGWTEDGDERYAELAVCGHCVPKHSHFSSRDAVPTYPCQTVRLLAQSYAGRDGWQEEWRS